MSLESWDPTAPTQPHSVQLTPDTLAKLIAYSANAQLDTLESQLAGDECLALSGLMKVEHNAWLEAIEALTDEEVIHLIRFLAVAENLPGWEALDTSPAIPIAKALRRRGVRLDKDFLRWLRTVSNNRYLPYGPL